MERGVPLPHEHFPAVESTRHRDPYPHSLEAGHSRFPAANAGRIAMTTPLTGRVMLANVLVRPSLSTDDTVLPGF